MSRIAILFALILAACEVPPAVNGDGCAELGPLSASGSVECDLAELGERDVFDIAVPAEGPQQVTISVLDPTTTADPTSFGCPSGVLWGVLFERQAAAPLVQLVGPSERSSCPLFQVDLEAGELARATVFAVNAEALGPYLFTLSLKPL
jgi:hypothetical protein